MKLIPTDAKSRSTLSLDDDMFTLLQTLSRISRLSKDANEKLTVKLNIKQIIVSVKRFTW